MGWRFAVGLDYNTAWIKDCFMTRSEAQAQGLKTFNTGQPCNSGHNAARNTKSGRCIICNRDAVREFYRARATAKLVAKVAI